MATNQFQAAIGAAVIAAAILPAPSAAQSGDAPSEGVADIVVTAEKRTDSIQKLPLTITAFDAAKLQRLGLTSSDELGNYISNVQIALPSGKGNQPDISIRGVGLNDYNANNAGPNAVYLDEVYLSAPATQTFQTFDLKRIEVLKGPQSTLYGRNANGGAINYISEPPTKDFFASQDVTFGSYNLFQTQSIINGQLQDGVTARFAFVHNQSDGFFRNERDGKTTNDANDYAWRAQIKFQPNPDLNVLFNLHAGNVDRRPDEYHQLGTLQSAFGSSCATAAVLAGQCVDLFGYKSPSNLYKGNFNRDQKLKVHGEGGFVRIDYEPDGITLTSITAVEASERFHPEETDANPFQLLEINYTAKSREVSQEVRASGDYRGIQLLAGASFLHEDLLDAQIGSSLLGLDAFAGPGAGDGTSEIRSVADNQTTDAYAGYAQANIGLTDRLHLTLGGRYTYETKDFDAAGFDTVQGVGAPSGQFGPSLPTYHFLRHLLNNATSGRAVLDFQLAPHVLAYASISTGFKSGGFNGGLLSNNPADAFRQLQPIRPETIKAYEVGMKSDLFDKRLRLNLAGFYYDYSELQTFNIVSAAANGGLPVNVLTNVPHATIKGVDAELDVKPVPALTLGLTLGYLDTSLGTFVNGAGTGAPVTYTGKRFPIAPRYSLVGSAVYDIVLANEDSVQISSQISYRTRQFFDSSNDPLTTQGAYWLVDLRAAYRTADGRWQFAVFGKNVTNQKYINYAVDLGNPYGLVQQVVGTPLVVAGQITRRF